MAKDRLMEMFLLSPTLLQKGCKEVDKVIRRNIMWPNKEEATASKKKSDLSKLATEVNEIRHPQAMHGIFFLTNRHLTKIIAWKRQKGTNKLPSKKKEDRLA